MASIGQQITGALRGPCQKHGFKKQCQTRLRLSAGASASQRRYLSDVITGDFAALKKVVEKEKIQAAPGIDLGSLKLAQHARAVPVSPSYFSRQAQFNDAYITLQKLSRNYANLPRILTSEVKRVTWTNLDDIRLILGEPVKASDYAKCIRLVKDLHAIHPKLKPKAVEDALEPFKHSVQAFDNVAKPGTLDKFGRAVGVGKRKSSVARAWVVEGTGEFMVNGKSLADAFGRVHDRESASWALQATNRADKYNVWAVVEGGGTTGQAEALTLAVAKGLMVHEPALKPALRRGETYTIIPMAVGMPEHHEVSGEGPRLLTLCSPLSRMCDTRSKKGGEKEGRPRQGQKVANLGQEIKASSSALVLVGGGMSKSASYRMSKPLGRTVPSRGFLFQNLIIISVSICSSLPPYHLQRVGQQLIMDKRGRGVYVFVIIGLRRELYNICVSNTFQSYPFPLFGSPSSFLLGLPCGVVVDVLTCSVGPLMHRTCSIPS